MSSRRNAVLGSLQNLHRGKVRDTFALPDYPELLAVRASDRISIFDFVLNAEVAQKGTILTALNHFWRRKVIGDLFPHDLVAAGAEVDEYLPEVLRGDPDLQARLSIVRKLDMRACEAIVRRNLTGTGITAYRENGGMVCGQQLSPGLQDGMRLPYLLFAPTSKALIGHDEHLTMDEITERFGVGIERFALALFQVLETHVERCDFLLADTKFEFGINPETGRLTLGDEVCTPDSSRFWNKGDWLRAQQATPPGPPPGFDKQPVREWGKTLGIHRRLPENPGDVDHVHSLQVPQAVLDETIERYRHAFYRLTGQKLEAYQRSELGIAIKPHPLP